MIAPKIVIPEHYRAIFFTVPVAVYTKTLPQEIAREGPNKREALPIYFLYLFAEPACARKVETHIDIEGFSNIPGPFFWTMFTV
jgi:hypothetical protein